MELAFSSRTVNYFIAKLSDDQRQEDQTSPSPSSSRAEVEKGTRNQINNTRLYLYISKYLWLHWAWDYCTGKPSTIFKFTFSRSTIISRKKEGEEKFHHILHFYKSIIHSRLTMLGIVYAWRNFIKITTHQPHKEGFYATFRDTYCRKSNMGSWYRPWQHEVGRPTLYPQCHLEKIQTEKYWKGFDITVGLSRRIYNYYLDFEK